MGSKRYSGRRDKRGQGVVHIIHADGDSSLLNWRLDVRNHNPETLDWGDQGPGSAQLALALILDAHGAVDVALRLYEPFKERVISLLPREKWMLTHRTVINHLEEIALELRGGNR